jgi:integrase
MAVNECAQLRIQDIDFENSSIIVRNGKGANDCHTETYWHVFDVK